MSNEQLELPPDSMTREQANLEHLGRVMEHVREQILVMTPKGQTFLLTALYNPEIDQVALSIPEGLPRLVLAGLLMEITQASYHSEAETKDTIKTSEDRNTLWSPNDIR